MMKRNATLVIGIIFAISLSCSFLGDATEGTEAPTTSESVATSQPPITKPVTQAQPSAAGEALIQPSDLVYLGAFRLPDGPEEIGWAYGGTAMTYYPGGDPDGPEDGFPGSIFATGHEWNQYVSEIDIPVPVISTQKNAAELNMAATLQEFQNVRGRLFNWSEFEMPRVGLAYLPRQGSQVTDKLYFCWAQHLQDTDTGATHGWSELDLTNPQPAGIWRVGGYWKYVTCDYMFDIPQPWADSHTPGMNLATGRYRDGGQGARGPALFAIGPWNQGNPPTDGSTLAATPLLLYSDVTAENENVMQNYHHSDEWNGGAWITAGEKAALIFVGTKGLGECWYGCSDGTVWPEEPPFPPGCPNDDRGWWSTSFEGQILFYDPAQLAAVVQGALQSWEPQPYAVLNIDPVLFNVHHTQQKGHVGAVSFDRINGLLYLFEPFADGEKPIVHVWRIQN